MRLRKCYHFNDAEACRFSCVSAEAYEAEEVLHSSNDAVA